MTTASIMAPAAVDAPALLRAAIAAHPPSEKLRSRLRLDPTPPAAVLWSDLGEPGCDALDRWLGAEVEAQPGRGMDAKAAAAHLVGTLGYALSGWLVRLRHAGAPVRALPGHAVQARVHLVRWDCRGNGGVSPVVDFWVDPDGVSLARSLSDADGATAVGEVVALLMRPVIDALHARARLARAALWRQLADVVADAFVEHGTEVGTAERAMADAERALAVPPLWNRQRGFALTRVEACPATGRPVLDEWFPVRGGCCRYHTLEGGEYCATCVHRDPDSREAMLREHLMQCHRAA